MNTTNPNLQKTESNYILYRSPYKVNIYDLIRNIHDEINHRWAEDTRKEMKKRKIIYRGLSMILNMYYLDVLLVYKRIKMIKRNIEKTIIFNYPKDRYVLDLTDLPFYIDINDAHKYILNIIDHFFKLCRSYLLRNKTAFNIIKCIEDFIEIYGPPKSIGTDNRREFKNKLLSDFMNKRNIKFI